MNERHQRQCAQNQELRGTVTSVNQELLFFIIDNLHTVNLGYLLSQKSTLHLPNIYDEVIVTNTHYSNPCVSYACEKSTVYIAGSFNNWPISQNDCLLKRLISEWRLGVADLSSTYAMFVKLQSCYKLTVQLRSEIALNLLKLILEYRDSTPLFSGLSCLNTNLPLFHLKSVCDCKFVDIRRAEYKKFPYWSFGLHPSNKLDLLVGYLYVHPKYGTFMLKDTNYKIICLILNPTEALKDMTDSFVLINKFYVLTEVYEDPAVDNLECIIVNFKNIKLLQQIGNISEMYNRCGADTANNLKNYLIFELKSVSVTMVCANNIAMRWLQLSVLGCDDSSVGKNILLSVKQNFMKILPFLIEGHCYKLQYNKALEMISNREFQRFYPHYQQFTLVDDQFVLNLEERSEPTAPLMNVSQCKQYIATFPKNLVSFRGKIKTKKFSDPLSSRTSKQIQVFGFGTPGHKTHCIEFAVEGDFVKTLSFYLNNWENHLLPFGLIPGMVLCVKNVSHQKGKYVKATPMTSFEILGYESDIVYTPVNLFTGNGDDWGTPFYLSLGNKIPYGVLVWSEIQSLWVRTLRISAKPVKCCSEKGTTSCKCPDSNPSAFTLDTTITILVQDIFGIAKVISNSLELLQVLLNLQPQEWEVWTKAFHHIKTYEFKAESTVRHPKNVLFSDVLTNAIDVLNSRGIFKLDLCCRKLDSNDPYLSTEPVWYYIKARKNC